MKLTLEKIAQICDGKIIGNKNKIVTGFFTDSRQAENGKMFVPIKGEKVDGHKFIFDVIDKGACTFSENVYENIDAVLVENCVEALQKVALYHRKSFDIPFIGITGSVGKTTSKDMLSLVLSSGRSVLKTDGNANSQVGVPLTVLRVEDTHEVAVVEMGISMPGEMARISKSVQADIAVISNIGISHIEFLGSKEGILEEKLHIADYIGGKGRLFVNGDDELLAKLKETSKLNVVSFGLAENSDYRATELVEGDMSSEFTLQCPEGKYRVVLPVAGAHNVRNALMSIAVAVNIGIDICVAIDSLKEYKTPSMRQEVKKMQGFTVIDDTYNASPDSVIASLDILKSSKAKRKIAVLADMLELGSYSKEAHYKMGEYAKECKVDRLYCVGEEAKETAKAFNNEEKSACFKDSTLAAEALLSEVEAGDVILIKGSRGMKTDIIVSALKKIKKN